MTVMSSCAATMCQTLGSWGGGCGSGVRIWVTDVTHRGKVEWLFSWSVEWGNTEPLLLGDSSEVVLGKLNAKPGTLVAVITVPQAPVWTATIRPRESKTTVLPDHSKPPHPCRKKD